MPLSVIQDAQELGEKILAELRELNEGIEALREASPAPTREVLARRYGTVTIGASGIGDVEVGPPPPGWAWQLQRLATTGGAGGTLVVYLDSVDPLNLVEVVDSPQEYADEFGNTIYVPENRKLVFRFRTQPAGTICTVAMQVRQYREEHDPLPAHIQ